MISKLYVSRKNKNLVSVFLSVNRMNDVKPFISEMVLFTGDYCSFIVCFLSQKAFNFFFEISIKSASCVVYEEECSCGKILHCKERAPLDYLDMNTLKF